MKWQNLSAAALLAVLFSIPAGVDAAAPGEPAPAVRVAPVMKLQATAPRRYVGVVEAIERVDLVPRVTGNLTKVAFTEGEIVQAGQLLYEIEDTTYRARVEQLKAQKEVLNAALHYALTEFKRSSTLLERQAVAVSSHDKAQLEIDSARANLKELDAALLDAENTLSYTRIHAPITGRIGKNRFSRGNLLTPAGGKLNDIVMVAPIYVKFNLSERTFRKDFGGLEHIRETAAVRIRLADGGDYHEQAKIVLVDNKIDAATDTITCYARFANQDQRLLPGSFVTVLLSTASEKPFPAIVPSALIVENDRFFVYILKNGKVEKRPVTAGRNAGTYLQILSGLDGSETVIVDGTHKVAPGMTVRPLPARQPETR